MVVSSLLLIVNQLNQSLRDFLSEVWIFHSKTSVSMSSYDAWSKLGLSDTFNTLNFLTGIQNWLWALSLIFNWIWKIVCIQKYQFLILSKYTSLSSNVSYSLLAGILIRGWLIWGSLKVGYWFMLLGIYLRIFKRIEQDCLI